MHNQVDNKGLFLPADPKPSLRWTRELHECFVQSVSQLGGVDKATSKSVMQIMGVPGLTLYHLKSHLQKYRLEKNREMSTFRDNSKQDSMDIVPRTIASGTASEREDTAQPQFNETMLEIQMEMQRKLQEQIEVQRHLQLRIEAQGKYLQSVLQKAHETFASYMSNFIGVEATKAELSELVSAAESLSSAFSRRGFTHKQTQHADCSTDSCLTSSERTVAKKPYKLEHHSSSTGDSSEESDESNPDWRKSNKVDKRNRSSVYCESHVEQNKARKRLCHRGKSFEKEQELDLNRLSHQNNLWMKN